ncbi:xanthine/uracil/vitamin C permease [Campylobacter subantarcticus LMG 24377]|uniref:Xanthine/uracil/vitamin C permease n=2 Tax=Campylobacter subantarcticus TaxID=497724 RepID=A0A0A8H8D2_9BACT|nr:NCS2 family permease [Campylobacter subantarcticus]EAJ1261175.1 NCS2 family permease [Campylobacter lari]AJC90341.1 xanthine/uracil/vitamin C permease [Campylobacter subantarcticus LMG 24374]AJC92003.1 xanthine/uracil/vitamin C permease [Campylobacter subantarcticus LMG 24377]EAL3939331.1 NCS2 family permease [Campylobacter lari]MPB98691.1 NCS2 family permease [Campylobacter subantarcticus]
MDFFKLKEHKTDVKTEIYAGIATFLAMIYIIPVNANIMSNSGMPLEALIVATALVTIIATTFSALFSNTPVAMSVGMGLNAYFTFSVCNTYQVPWQSALGAVFLSGVIFTLLSFTNFRIWVIKSIPNDLRKAISAGIGTFIAFMGLVQMGIITKNEATLVGLGDFSSTKVLFGLFGLFLVFVFWAWRIKAAFILAVFVSALCAWIFGIDGAQFPEQILSLPVISGDNGLSAIFGKLDIQGALELSMIPVVLTFFVTQLFDSVGTITGVGSRGKIFDDPKQGEKKLGKTLGADAASSAMGAVVGTSTVTAFVESSAGVEAGGRTGLTALVTAICFVFTLFLLPVFKAIPANSIYPILVLVGVLMFMEVASINFKDKAIAVSAFFIIIMMPLTYSITTGFAFGFIAYLLMRLMQKELDKINLGIIVLSAISLLVFLLQFL